MRNRGWCTKYGMMGVCVDIQRMFWVVRWIGCPYIINWMWGFFLIGSDRICSTAVFVGSIFLFFCHVIERKWRHVLCMNKGIGDWYFVSVNGFVMICDSVWCQKQRWDEERKSERELGSWRGTNRQVGLNYTRVWFEYEVRWRKWCGSENLGTI